MSTEVTASTGRSLTERVAEEIRVLLTRRRVRQAQLAKALGVSEQWVSVRLRGVQAIDLNDLERIAAILGVDVADLLPRPSEGRVIATGEGAAAHPIRRSGALAGRQRLSSGRAILAQLRRHSSPNGRSQTRAATAPPTVLPIQRRPTLIRATGRTIPSTSTE